jgi:hypothetical protein
LSGVCGIDTFMGGLVCEDAATKGTNSRLAASEGLATLCHCKFGALDRDRFAIRRAEPVGAYVRGLLPWTRRMIRMTSPTTSRIWINPPNVYEVIIPNSHKTTNTNTRVQSMATLLWLYGAVHRPRESVT